MNNNLRHDKDEWNKAVNSTAASLAMFLTIGLIWLLLAYAIAREAKLLR